MYVYVKSVRENWSDGDGDGVDGLPSFDSYPGSHIQSFLATAIYLLYNMSRRCQFVSHISEFFSSSLHEGCGLQ